MVCDRGLTLGDLIGILHLFFSRLGLKKLRFKPAFNPYTEPSMEIFSYSEQLQKWVEVRAGMHPACMGAFQTGLLALKEALEAGYLLDSKGVEAADHRATLISACCACHSHLLSVQVGNSGMFRPEMLRPMGLPEDVNVIAWGLGLERLAQ